ncbi:NADP-dependent oxidoreductase [Subtercola vilae]|uniref:NADP-dependent oxidoreductase n=1 Tax=Subtercola vilae TaxID=2056433 RepID=A0A4T2CBR5_9MICO|nr:NADP-dependent oxidoreductase [Subtercola vilae]TIH41022.1 NADP-dependent oxidoreductase [Subtercola vilae]
MKAITFGSYGGTEVLEIREVARPVAGVDEVLVRVRLAAVNPYDLKLRSGAMSEFVKTTFPVIPGSEMAGVVEAVGIAVEGLSVGDEVFGWATSGGYAEFATARVVALKPSRLHWDVAVALPVAGETALRALGLLKLTPGETLVIHGAAGSVGAIAVQLAVAHGITVIGTGSARDSDTLRKLGAHPVLYGDGVFERIGELAPDGVDAVLDTAGRGVLPGSIELVGGPERVVTIADPAAYGLGVVFSSGGARDQTSGILAELAALAVAGELTVPPTRHFAFDDVAAAQAAVAAGGQRGKVVLDV